jgi:hypothetical protein
MKNNYERDIQRWLALIYSQLKLTRVLFLGGKSRRGWVEKLGSTLGLYFSKRGLVPPQKHRDQYIDRLECNSLQNKSYIVIF